MNFDVEIEVCKEIKSWLVVGSVFYLTQSLMPVFVIVIHLVLQFKQAFTSVIVAVTSICLAILNLAFMIWGGGICFFNNDNRVSCATYNFMKVWVALGYLTIFCGSTCCPKLYEFCPRFIRSVLA